MSKAELQKWLSDSQVAQVDSEEITVPPNLIRALLARSVIDNWPHYEVAENSQGDPVAIRFGSAAAANKALEMLAKDAGMLADQVKVSGRVEITIRGVDPDDHV